VRRGQTRSLRACGDSAPGLAGWATRLARAESGCGGSTARSICRRAGTSRCIC